MDEAQKRHTIPYGIPSLTNSQKRRPQRGSKEVRGGSGVEVETNGKWAVGNFAMMDVLKKGMLLVVITLHEFDLKNHRAIALSWVVFMVWE